MSVGFTPRVTAFLRGNLGLDDAPASYGAPEPPPAYDPRDADSGAHEQPSISSYNDPAAGGTISQPLPTQQPEPSYTLVDGRTAPPTQTGNWEPVTNLTQPYDSRAYDEGPRETGPVPWTPLSATAQPVTPPQTADSNPYNPLTDSFQLPDGLGQNVPGRIYTPTAPIATPRLAPSQIPDMQAREAAQQGRPAPPRQASVSRQEPAEDAAQAIERDQQYTQPQALPTLPGSSGRMLTEGVRTAQQTGQPISPLSLYSAFSELPFDVYQAAYDRAVIAADRDISGTDPLAPFRGLGINLPSEEDVNPEKRPAAVVLAGLLMSGVLPDPADPYVAAAFKGAGRAIGATGRRLAAEGRTIGTVAGNVAEAGSRALSNAGEAAARNVPAGETQLGSGFVPSSGQAATETAPPFFSQLRRTVEQKMPNRAMPQQIEGILRGSAVKPDEIAWTGFDDWLREQKGPVTKQQVLDFLDQNEVKIEEVVKGNTRPRADGSGVEFDPESGPTRYDGFRLPGGKNYRELLLTLPRKADGPSNDNLIWRQTDSGRWAWFDRDTQVSGAFPDNADAESARATVTAMSQRDTSSYQSSHWNEPNVLAHVRFNERVAPDGARTLLVEEIQSDWHQAGRRQGYKDPKIKAALDAKFQRGETLTADEIDLYNQSVNDAVPDAPFKKTWPELAIKRMIRWAAENDFDRIAWPPGSVHAERYAGDGVDRGAGMAGFYDQILPTTAQKIGKKFGARVGQTRIEGEIPVAALLRQAQQDVDAFPWAVIDGRPGKERLVLQTATLQEADRALDAGQGKYRVNLRDEQANGGQAVHSMDITPQMRQSVMQEGQPLFANARIDPSSGGIGMPDLRNAAQGAFLGAAMPDMADPDRDIPQDERNARMAAGAVAGFMAGRRMGRGRGTRVPGQRMGSGFVADSGPTPRSRMNMDDVATRAAEVMGVKPEQVRAWQAESLNEPAYGRAVRGSALQQAANIDEDAAMRAIERLEAAQNAVRATDDVTRLSDVERLDIADAALEAAEAARAFQGSKAASTAEGRATARALAQRRQQIVARQGVVSAERAKQVGQDAAFAANAVRRIERSGRMTPKDEQLLRTVREKLADAERNGLTDDGVGGKLDRLEQARTPATANGAPKPPAPGESAERMRNPGMRSQASQYEPGWGTVIAREAGSQLGGGAIGATVGAAVDEENPQRGAAAGFALGAGSGYAARRMSQRFPTKGGTFATFGFSPTPDNPTRSVAMGSDPSKRYTFRYRVVDLDNLTTSHTPGGAPNPAFPQELQPRDRGRAASMQQVDRIARGLSPDALLYDAGRLDSGPMIVGPDMIVESGNGRTLALRRAADQYPEQYGQYVESMRQNLGEYGLDESALQGVNRPVLVRERLSEVDRAAFAAEANNAGLLRMSGFETAAQDAANLSDEAVSSIVVGENDTIASALRRTENRDLVRSWVGTLPANEQAGVIDAEGNLSAQGYERLTNALLMRTYGEGAGSRLVRAFVESADPTVRNIQAALMASLPDVARSEAMIRAGTRDAGLSIAEDVAAAVEMLARLRRDGVRVSEYLAQSAMFDRELTPFQEQILGFMDRNVRRQGAIRETLQEYARRVENAADPNQVGMFGEEIAPIGREDAWRGAATAVERQAAENQAARRARANGARLAQSGTDAENIIPATGGPAGELAIEGAPTVTPRPGSVEPLAPRGGPEGRLEVQGAPQPTPRPGPIEPIAPRGGPEGRLQREGAPPEPARLGPAEGMPATGGPEGTLRAPGAPEPLVRPTTAAPMDAPRRGPESTLQRSLTDAQRADDRLLREAEARNQTAAQREASQLDQSRIRGVVAQIDEVLQNPQAPGSIERLQTLYADLTEISQAGFTRSSEIRKRLQRNGLLRAGLASRTEDVDGLVQALARVDPNKPEEMRAILQIISKPRLIDKILEYQYVNMLSSPVTQGVNILSNLAQVSGRLLLQNPLEFVYSGGKSTGVGAAFEGAGRGFREALGEAGQIMRTGTSTKNLERAAELGDYGHVNREALTEQFGKAGAALHFISTRPLQAMDALLGNMAYASAAEQYAQRTADRLLKNGSESVKGMNREQARAHVMANIWDYPEVIEKAGKISDYTLLKSNDAKGLGYGNRAEATFRRVTSLGRPSETDGFLGQSMAFLFNQMLPFTNVPLNFAKQGAERTVGVPYNAGRAVGAFARGETERGAELAAKATIGAGALTAGIAFAWGDNLTGDGPSDPGQRAVWEQTHKRNSFRFGPNSPWISWEGTPWAIPFGMIAGAKENAGEAITRAAKKGESDPVDLGLSVAGGVGRGAWQGFSSQSFIKSLGQQYELMTGNQTGLGTVAASAAGTVSRFIPAGSMANFLARVGDTVERDAGKPQSASELPQNVADRIATRLPVARQTVDSKLDIYGEDAPNEQRGLGSVPYYRGYGARAGDPITQKVEAAGVGAPAAPAEITFREMKIPLEPKEQRAFQQAWGRAFRRELEGIQRTGKEYPADAYEKARANARDDAEGVVLRQLGSAEIRRRVEGRQPAGVR